MHINNIFQVHLKCQETPADKYLQITGSFHCLVAGFADSFHELFSYLLQIITGQYPDN
jgi:hypothetical protein